MITKESWGNVGGAAVYLYTLRNAGGMTVQVTSFGARIVSVCAPDRDGRMDNCIYGPDTLEGFTSANNFFGATIGRYCNRIAEGRFSLEGTEYRLTQNENGNTLHGGGGVHNAVWESAEDGNQVVMTLLSPDGSDGFPGNMTLVCRYTLTDDNTLVIGLQAVTDKPTVCCLTNHAYWSLGGAVTEHEVELSCDRCLSLDQELIPTGAMDVAGTKFDFRVRRPLGAGLLDFHSIANGRQPLARVWSPASGRTMTIFSDLPGVQLYTHPADNAAPGEAPTMCSVCLEPQFCPDSPNHPEWPSVVLRPGEVWDHDIRIRFGAE